MPERQTYSNVNGTYWYLFYLCECAVCGRDSSSKERVYDKPKPDDPRERRVYEQDCCPDHFM